MAKQTDLTGTNGLFLGVDYTYPFTIKNGAETACVDISGWALSYLVKRQAVEPDGQAMLSKQTGNGITISGVFSADPALNTQVATVAIADTDSQLLEAGECVYELKRTDTGAETVLAYGALTLIRSVHHA